MTHPITPPPELVKQWAEQSPMECSAESWAYELFIAHHAAQWGADQELEACCNLLELSDSNARDFLQSARRPKPSSLKRVALLQLNVLNADLGLDGKGIDLSQIRRALEQLDE